MPACRNGQHTGHASYSAGCNRRPHNSLNNLSEDTEDTESATANTWLVDSFGTGQNTVILSTATLLLSAAVIGSSAELFLYSDGGLEPGTLVGGFSSATSSSTTVSQAVFTTPGVNLESGSSYRLVLRVTSGEVNWAWTHDNTGSGAGFQHTWALSNDADASFQLRHRSAAILCFRRHSGECRARAEFTSARAANCGRDSYQHELEETMTDNDDISHHRPQILKTMGAALAVPAWDYPRARRHMHSSAQFFQTPRSPRGVLRR